MLALLLQFLYYIKVLNMIEVKLRKSEPIDYALKRLRSKTEKESLMDDIRRKKFHETPAKKKKRKARKKPLNIEWNFFPKAK